MSQFPKAWILVLTLTLTSFVTLVNNFSKSQFSGLNNEGNNIFLKRMVGKESEIPMLSCVGWDSPAHTDIPQVLYLIF